MMAVNRSGRLFFVICSLVFVHISSPTTPSLSAIPDLYKVYQGSSVVGNQVDDKGRLWSQKESLDRLQVLFNDLVFNISWKSCLEDKATRDNVYGQGGMGSSFEDVHAEAGFQHAHRTSMAVSPDCVFSSAVPFFNSGKQMQVPSSTCTPDYFTGGTAVGDYNGDGMEDIFFSVFHGRSVLYKNNGDGTFSNVTEETGIGPSSKANGAVWADLDQDGDLDLYVTTVGDTRHYLYINYGGHFIEEAMQRNCSLQTSDKRNLSGMTPSVGDFDNDGFLDIYVTEWIQQNLGQPSVSRLLRNIGMGYFEDVTAATGVDMDSVFQGPQPNRGTYTFGSSFTDFDNDGWPDLLVTADYGTSRLFLNRQNGSSFIECGNNCGINENQLATGQAIGDWNNDGRQDWFSSDLWDLPNYDGNFLYINQGGGNFTDGTQQAGVKDGGWAWGAAMTDFNNDGFQDIILTGGSAFPNTTMRLWQNLGAGQGGATQEVSSSLGLDGIGQGRGLLKWDYDDDGDEDYVLSNNVGPPFFYQNRLQNLNYWVKVRAVHRCTANLYTLCDSIGARVQVTMATNHIQTQEIGSNTHFLGQSSVTAHFGLGQDSRDVTVKVTWPRGSRELTYTGVPVGTRLRAMRPESGGDSGQTLLFSSLNQCYSLKVKEITKQPGKSTVSINPDERTLSLQLKPGYQISDLTMESFKYKMGLEPSPGGEPLVSSASVEVLFVSSGSHSFNVSECLAGRTGQTPSPTDDRRLDGISNNMQHVTWGANLDNVVRDVHAMYADNLALPAGGCTAEQRKLGHCKYLDGLAGIGSNRPSPRKISNELFHQTESRISARRLSDLHTNFGQFLAHDTDLTNNLPNSDFDGVFSDVWLPIDVPKGDVHFDPQNKGDVHLGFVRSLFNRCTGRRSGTPREQVNEISSYIDGSNVYGQTEAKSNFLRSFEDGKLKLGAYNILPDNTMGIGNHNPFGRDTDTLFATGDERANEQPGLMVLHALFVREHNRLCDEYKAKNPQAVDEQIFQVARRLVAAELQAITFREYLPSLLGGTEHIPAYEGYRDDVNAGMSNIMSTAAFRFGHSQVNRELWRFQANGTVLPYGHLALRDAYFSPERLKMQGGIDPILRGAVLQPAQEVDLKMVHDMRNVLFPGGRDLVSLNIQRGRDHGLPDFNYVRTALGLGAYSAFTDITSDKEVASKMEELYESIDNIDLWVGGLAEDHETGSELGATFRKIVMQNFLRIRDGDRFWYEGYLSDEEIEQVNSLTLGEIIRLNTDFKDAPDNVFFSSRDCADVQNFQCVQHSEPLTADENKGLITGLIVGCVLIFVVAVILAIVIVFLYHKIKKRSTKVTNVQPFAGGHTNLAWQS